MKYYVNLMMDNNSVSLGKLYPVTALAHRGGILDATGYVVEL